MYSVQFIVYTVYQRCSEIHQKVSQLSRRHHSLIKQDICFLIGKIGCPFTAIDWLKDPQGATTNGFGQSLQILQLKSNKI